MMRKNTLIALCCTLFFTILLSACGNGPGANAPVTSQSPSQPPAGTTYTQGFVKSTTGVTELRSNVCDQQGTIVSLDYETIAYPIKEATGAEEIITKSLSIYLPYNYDETKPYNILYLIHGAGETQNFWFVDERWGESTRNTLDNMIKDGICDPLIVVSTSFLVDVAGYEDDNLDVMGCFGHELRNSIIPIVESKYLTYANGDTGLDSLIASREHRGFAGFSMGGATSVRSGLMINTDIISYFGSYSLPLDLLEAYGVTAETFKETLESEQFKDYPIGFWYHGDGRGDFTVEGHEVFCDQVLEQMGDRFTDGENFAWINLRDGSHMYASWLADLYNSLLVFFK